MKWGASTALATPRGKPYRAPMKAALSHIENWVFDLDNTLYPASGDLWRQIDARIGAYVQTLLSVGPEDAHRIQKGYFHSHGTTLNGLMADHHRGGGAGNALHPVMLGDPIAGVAEPFDMARQIGGVGEGLGGIAPLDDGDEVEQRVSGHGS